jgi:hypothetical protein
MRFKKRRRRNSDRERKRERRQKEGREEIVEYERMKKATVN